MEIVLAGAGGLAAGRLAGPLAEPYCEVPRRRLAAIAAVTAVVSALLAWRFGATAELVAYLYLGVVGTLLAFIDVAVKRLPDPFTLPSYPVGAALLAIASVFADDGLSRFLGALAGMAVLWTVYAVQHFLMPDGLGRGDVKLAGVLGLYLGWLGQDAWMAGALAGAVLAGAYGIGLLTLRRASRKAAIPLGPFLLVGTLLAVVAS